MSYDVIARHPDCEVEEILADLAIDGVTGHPISLFDPKRLVTT